MQLKQLGVPFEADAAIGRLTWYEVGGCAEALVKPESTSDLLKVMQFCQETQTELRVLGGGANLLVRECGVSGIVLQLSHGAFSEVTVIEDSAEIGAEVPEVPEAPEVHEVLVRVGAGQDMMKMVQELARQGLSGLECLAGIPGSVGGGIRMNAGGGFGEIGPAVHQLEVIRFDAPEKVLVLNKDELNFQYRKSHLDDYLVVAAIFKLQRKPIDEVRAQVKEIFQYKKNSQPMAGRSAGCAFKNPDPKHPAGKLIDEAGLKGLVIAGAEVSDVHANFMVLKDEGKADDVAELMLEVKRRVKAHAGIELEQEVVVWP